MDFHQDVYAGERAPYAELKWRVRRACAAAGGFGACRTGAYLCAGSGGGARDVSDRRGSVKGFQRTRDRNDDGGQLSGNSGREIYQYQYATLTLYFANEAGDHLVKETRRVPYSTNIPLERVVVEQLMKGPKEDGPMQCCRIR